MVGGVERKAAISDAESSLDSEDFQISLTAGFETVSAAELVLECFGEENPAFAKGFLQVR